MRLSSLLILCASFSACADDGYRCFCSSITDYAIDPGFETPDGIRVDASGIDVDPSMIDALTTELEGCLKISIDRRGFDLKIAPDWFVTPNGHEGFPCAIEGGACAGTIQPPNHVIVAPNLGAYKHELIHLVTGYTDHDHPEFSCE